MTVGPRRCEASLGLIGRTQCSTCCASRRTRIWLLEPTFKEKAKTGMVVSTCNLCAGETGSLARLVSPGSMRDPVLKYKADDDKEEGHPKLSSGLYTVATRQQINTEK